MTSTITKSCYKYLLSHKDFSKNMQQIGIYARGASNCLLLARIFNSYLHDHPSSVVRIQQKF